MDWPKRELGELADISRGSSPRPIADTKYFDGGTVPWVKIADATKSGKFLYDTKQYVNDFGASFSRRLPPGTILVAASGTLGYTQILGVEGCAHDGWLILQNLRGLDRDFAYYALKTLEQHFFNSGSGAAIQNINTDILRKTEIPFPPLSSQRRIAGILSAYDELIENSQRRTRILEAMACALYREWFVHFRFPGHENHSRVPSSLGEVPEGWEVKRLDSLITTHIGGGWGKDPEDDKHTERAWVIRGTDIPNARRCQVEGVPHRYHTVSNLRPRRLTPGDIIFEVSGGSKGQPLGRTLLVTPEILSALDGDVMCASFCKRVQPDAENYGSELLYLSFLEGYESGEIEQFQVQSTGISNFKWKDYLAQTERVVPPAHLRSRFREGVKPLLTQVATLGLKVQNLRRTRDLLLPRLLSGQLELEVS